MDRQNPAELAKVAAQKREYARRLLIEAGKPTREQKREAAARARETRTVAAGLRAIQMALFRRDNTPDQTEQRKISADYMRAKYPLIRDRELQRVARYKAKNPDRKLHWEATRKAREVAQSDGTVTPEALANLKELTAQCYYCQHPLTGRKSVDHKTPLCAGGAHSLANLAITCKLCNTRKGRLTEAQFFERLAVEPHRVAA